MKKADEFLRDGVGFIERKFFEFVEDRGIGDDCNVEGVGDGGRQDAGIHGVRAQERHIGGRRGW